LSLQGPAASLYAGPDQPILRTPSYFMRIHFNTILLSTPRSSKIHCFLSHPHRNPLQAFPVSPICATWPAHLICLYLFTRIICGKEGRSCRLSLCSLLHYPVTSSLWGPNISLSTLFSSTLSLCPSLNVKDQVLHLHKKRGKITVLYTFSPIFIFKCIFQSCP